MQRIFHSIGQGAYYSEHFNRNGASFNVVYDCGSATFRDRKLKVRVNAAFHEDEVIDILFISHFHADHISGIDYLKKRCQINNVVIPYLDDDAKVLLKAANYRERGNEFGQIIDDPEGFFGKTTRVIQVMPAEDQPEVGVVNFERPYTVRPDDNQLRGGSRPISNTINSGEPIHGGEPEWYYVPYNFELKARLAKFTTALSARGLTVDDLKGIGAIQKYKRKITEAYDEVEGDLNKNSLVLFSGKTVSDRATKALFGHVNSYHFLFRRLHEIECGCLYTGDCDLNEPNIVGYLHSSLRRVADFIGCIQVPHHGAIKNHNPEFYPRFAHAEMQVVSVGTTNVYGHPSARVLADLFQLDQIVHCVTEHVQSEFLFLASDNHII